MSELELQIHQVISRHSIELADTTEDYVAFYANKCIFNIQDLQFFKEVGLPIVHIHDSIIVCEIKSAYGATR